MSEFLYICEYLGITPMEFLMIEITLANAAKSN